ncbi:hypothetical protein [Roseococcus suduntuyensis]|uniref:Putative membrane protein n=1 Tax=Roseococcus suduntuyensis TaxID=455361 RepID=A0A840AA13_9PROT|nr:hypothetical protein [Roseococcus suduntuyensis]MBB3897732.1 putative membrane protein [Roseococcus suduntuyensis]
MPVSSVVFMVMAALMVLAGMFVVTLAEGFFYAWGLMLIAFGLFYGYGIVKRYFDAQDRMGL